MATVQFRHVHKKFPDGTHAVRDFELEIRDRELMVLVGPSGCGKSTLLRMLAGLEGVSGGEILIDGRHVNALPPQQRNIAMVFQEYALYPHMTVRKNLEFPLKMRGLDRQAIQQRVDTAATILDLVPLLGRKPAQLSGGQKQRVAMGRAIVREPAVFLMDEPLSNLDARLRVQIRAEIAALQRRLNTTMIYVTHDQVEAMTLGDRVAVLNQGVLQQVATPHQLYTKPANVFVAEFIGSPGMNLFPTRVSQGSDGQYVMHWAGQALVLPAAMGQCCPGLARFLDQPVIAGVRPEALRLAAETTATTPVAARVDAVEILGHECLVHVLLEEVALSPTAPEKSNNVTMVARVPGKQTVNPGDRIALGVLPKDLCIFAPDGNVIE